MKRTELKSKSALIIGASSGIGLESARLLHAQGIRVIGAARTLGRFCELGDDVDFYTINVCDAQEVHRLIENLAGEISCVICSVGIGYYAPLTKDYSEAWEKILRTNIIGSLNIMAAIAQRAPDLQQFISIGSLAAFRPSATPGNAVYGASKTALKDLLESFRTELRCRGRKTKVSNIVPGYVGGTSFANEFFSTDRDASSTLYSSFTPLDPIEVAQSISWVLHTGSNMEISTIIIRPINQPN